MLKVLFLGTSGSMPTVARSLPAILIKRDGESVLFDCGEGTQRQMMRCRTGFNLSSVFITHWHADHFLGLPGLIHTMSFQNRGCLLHISEPTRLLSISYAVFCLKKKKKNLHRQLPDDIKPKKNKKQKEKN